MVMKSVYFDGAKAASLGDMDGFMDYLLGGDSPDVSAKNAYRSVPWLYRAVTMRANSVASVPFTIYRGETEVDSSEDYQNKVGFLPNPAKLLRMVEASLATMGRAYLFNTHNRAKTLGLRYLLPTSIEPRIDERLGLIGWIRNLNGVLIPWPLEDVVWFWGDDPFVEFGPPKASPATAALEAAGVLMNVDQFASAFAARGMIKATILRVPPGTAAGEKDRLKEWWQQIVGGIKNAFSTHVLNADAVEPTIIGSGLEELANVQLTDDKRKDISTALGVPASKLFSGSAAGLGGGGVAAQDDVNLYKDTILPECEMIQSVLNEQIFIPSGYRWEFQPQTMDIFQEDERQRSYAFSSYVSAGLPMHLVAEMLGLELPEGWDYDDLEAYQEKKEQERAERAEQFKPKPAGQSPEDEDEKEGKEDERRWRSVALRQFKAGQSAAYNFQSDCIHPARHAQITNALVVATTPEEVKAAFAAGFPSVRGRVYP